MFKGYNYDVITDYIDGKTHDFTNIRMIGNKREIEVALNKYASIYPNRKSDIDNLLNNLDELLSTTKKVPMYVHTIDEYFEGKIDFRCVRLLGTKKQVITLLEKYKNYNPSKTSDVDNIINNIDEYFVSSRILPRYVNVINSYLNNEIDFKELKKSFETKKLMLEYLTKYKNRYPDKSSRIDIIIKNIDELIDDCKEVPLYQKIITDYIDGIISFDEVMNLGSIAYIKNRLKKYAELYPSKEDEIEEMFIELDKHYKTDTKIIDYDLIITRYINGFISNDEINRLYTKDKFILKLKKYILKHPENKGYVLSIINNIDNIFQHESRENNMNEQKEVKQVGGRAKKNNDLIKDVLYSSLSIEEYCSNTGESVNKIKNICTKYTKSDDLDKVNIGKMLLERSSIEFLNKLKNDVLTELLKEDADIFDYLNITRLKPRDFREAMNGLIPHEMIIDILTRIDLYRIDPINNLHTIINKDAKMSSIITIDGRVVTQDEKEKVFSYLEDNNYPLCLFNSALKKYVSGKLIIDSKTFVKE